MEGQLSHKIKALNEEEMDKDVPFDRFPLLPVEIRLMIWKLFLPGARVLSVSDSLPDFGYRENSFGLITSTVEKLAFRKHDNPPNPGALSICQESRAVALQRYRLCFGTSHVYADLLGGDVIYFGHVWKHYFTAAPGGRCVLVERLFHERNGSPRLQVSHEISGKLLVDLQQISFLALHNFMGSTGWDWSPLAIRSVHIRRTFTNLKRLILVHGGSTEKGGQTFFSTPGSIEFHDTTSFPRETFISLTNGDQYRNSRFRIFKEAQFLGETLPRLYQDTSDVHTDTKRVEVRTALANRVPNIPEDD
jgi:hypothetical protein